MRPPTIDLPPAPDFPEREEAGSEAPGDVGGRADELTDAGEEQPAAKTRRGGRSVWAVFGVLGTLLSIIGFLYQEGFFTADHWQYTGRFWKKTFRDIVRDPLGAPGSLKWPARRQPPQPHTQPSPFGDLGGPPLVGPNLMPAVGLPPLHKAALAGDREEAERVLGGGADVNAKDPDGWTALHWAASGGDVGPLDDLMDMPMPGLPGGQGWGPLGAEGQLAEQRKLLRKLHQESLRHAMPPGSQRPGSSPGGKTADHLGVVRLLLKHGADVNARTLTGKTPLKLALDGDHAEIADLLRQHGAAQEAGDATKPD